MRLYIQRLILYFLVPGSPVFQLVHDSCMAVLDNITVSVVPCSLSASLHVALSWIRFTLDHIRAGYIAKLYIEFTQLHCDQILYSNDPGTTFMKLL